MTVMDRILIQHYQSPCGELILGSFGDKYVRLGGREAQRHH